MPASFLKRHRTICMVLEEIRTIANSAERNDSVEFYIGSDMKYINTLIDEAKDYAQRMSARLVDRKNEVAELQKVITTLLEPAKPD